MGSIWDDSRLHAARSYTSSPDSPFSLRSSFTQYTTPTSSSVFLSCFLALLYPSSSSLRTPHLVPYHRILRSWTFSEISPTFVLPLLHGTMRYYKKSLYLIIVLQIECTAHRCRSVAAPSTTVLQAIGCYILILAVGMLCVLAISCTVYVQPPSLSTNIAAPGQFVPPYVTVP